MTRCDKCGTSWTAPVSYCPECGLYGENAPAVPHSATDYGLPLGADKLISTADLAAYWLEGGRKAEDRSEAFICAENSANVWKNAAYAMAERLAIAEAARSERLVSADYEEVLADHRRLVREIDAIINGEAGAAKQASLCDLIPQIKQLVGMWDKAEDRCPQCGTGIAFARTRLSARREHVGWIQEHKDGRLSFYQGDLDPRIVHDNGMPCYPVFK